MRGVLGLGWSCLLGLVRSGAGQRINGMALDDTLGTSWVLHKLDILDLRFERACAFTYLLKCFEGQETMF